MNNSETPSGEEGDHDPHFEPVIILPEIVVNTFEEDESILIKERAKLFRHDSQNNEWKERGTGEVKLLYNEELNTVRVLMRREKTYKLCANHYVTQDMELKPNCGSDRAWVWTTAADVSDGEPHAEVLAIKFQNTTAAYRWKNAFDKSKDLIKKPNGEKPSKDAESSDSQYSSSDDSQDEVVNKVNKLTLKATESKTEDCVDDVSNEEAKDGVIKEEENKNAVESDE
ncbi:ran-specific GTPase-activating protein-like isoform X2 [Cimex lectularius]|uniref:RanBD1 domain-containing protein n=1 Tax=Cimex lectularius TaxID=79782 RepID=A0A8I6R801_CIMLE|nr:ran-specific GTPase-activating protein-like isoform X2 [Cimex lectularius]